MFWKTLSVTQNISSNFKIKNSQNIIILNQDEDLPIVIFVLIKKYHNRF